MRKRVYNEQNVLMEKLVLKSVNFKGNIQVIKDGKEVSLFTKTTYGIRKKGRLSVIEVSSELICLRYQ